MRTPRVHCEGRGLGPCPGHQDPECHVVWAEIEGKKKKKVGTRRDEAGREGRVPGSPWARQTVLSPSGHLVSGMRSKEGGDKVAAPGRGPESTWERGAFGAHSLTCADRSSGVPGLQEPGGPHRAEAGSGS